MEPCSKYDCEHYRQQIQSGCIYYPTGKGEGMKHCFNYTGHPVGKQQALVSCDQTLCKNYSTIWNSNCLLNDTQSKLSLCDLYAIGTTSQVTDDLTKTQQKIAEVCDGIKDLLLEKNRKYGDSAIHPVRVFSKCNPLEQIDVRIDDKLSRITSGQTDDIEDVVDDLIGYLVLRKVAEELQVKEET